MSQLSMDELKKQNETLFKFIKVNNEIFDKLSREGWSEDPSVSERAICFDAMLVGKSLMEGMKR